MGTHLSLYENMREVGKGGGGAREGESRRGTEQKREREGQGERDRGKTGGKRKGRTKKRGVEQLERRQRN